MNAEQSVAKKPADNPLLARRRLLELATAALDSRNVPLLQFLLLSPRERKRLLALAGYAPHVDIVSRPPVLLLANACRHPVAAPAKSPVPDLAALLFHLVTRLTDPISRQLFKQLLGVEAFRQDQEVGKQESSVAKTSPRVLSLSEVQQARTRLFLNKLQCERVLLIREAQLLQIKKMKIAQKEKGEVGDPMLLLRRLLGVYAEERKLEETLADCLAQLSVNVDVQSEGIVLPLCGELPLHLNNEANFCLIKEALRAMLKEELSFLAIRIAGDLVGGESSEAVSEARREKLPRLCDSVYESLKATQDSVPRENLEDILKRQVDLLIHAKGALGAEQEKLKVALEQHHETKIKRQASVVERLNVDQGGALFNFLRRFWGTAAAPGMSVVATATTSQAAAVSPNQINLEEVPTEAAEEKRRAERAAILKPWFEYLNARNWRVEGETLLARDDNGVPLLAYLVSMSEEDHADHYVAALLRCAPEALLAETKAGERVVGFFKPTPSPNLILKRWCQTHLFAPLQGHVFSDGAKVDASSESVLKLLVEDCFLSDANYALLEPDVDGKSAIERLWDMPEVNPAVTRKNAIEGGNESCANKAREGRHTLDKLVSRVNMLSYFLERKIDALRVRQGVRTLLAWDLAEVLNRYEAHILQAPCSTDPQVVRVHEERKVDRYFFYLACVQLVEDYTQKPDRKEREVNEQRVMQCVIDFSYSCLRRPAHWPGFPVSTLYGLFSPCDTDGALAERGRPGLCGVVDRYHAGEYSQASDERRTEKYLKVKAGGHSLVRLQQREIAVVVAQQVAEQEEIARRNRELAEASAREASEAKAEAATAKAEAATAKAEAATAKAKASNADAKASNADAKASNADATAASASAEAVTAKADAASANAKLEKFMRQVSDQFEAFRQELAEERARRILAENRLREMEEKQRSGGGGRSEEHAGRGRGRGGPGMF